EEIFEKVDDELKKIERSGMLPAGVFLIGGGAQLTDLVEVAKAKLRLPACVGTNKNLSAIIDKVNDPAYLTALGLVAWGNQSAKPQKRLTLFAGSAKNSLDTAVGLVKNWAKKLMP
ncbi:MAG: Cell division protein ftsA, partial [Candidatus Falkowbacteria bacterium GW2011_GWF2_39_8]